MASANRLSCFGARYKGICDNGLTIRRDEVEARVLKALQERLLNKELFEEFCDEFTREMNRLRMQHRADLSAAEREIDRIEARRRKLVESIMDGVPASEVKDELKANALRREALQAKLAAADGHDLVLVARGRDELQALAQELNARHGNTVRVISKDLSESGVRSTSRPNVLPARPWHAW